MGTITIDGRQLEFKENQTVIQVAHENGIDIPHFCYHPKLQIAGNCRMCLVEVEGCRKPEISCNLPCRDGMVVKTNSPMVLKDRKAVLEFILVNHPIDCPICDKAGECMLQDQYRDFSSQPSRFQEFKVHKPKVKELGSLVMLDDERCIMCTRCVRFCADVAGNDELCIINRGDHSELTTFTGEPMTNPYQLNTVDLCPVGALTSRDFRFKKRVWFLTSTPSVCTGCATGCNTTIDHHEGVVYRYMPRENELINQCWLCDEGRLSYKFINENRLLAPLAHVDGEMLTISWEESIKKITGAIHQAGSENVSVVLSAQCTNEENKAWHYMATEVFHSGHIFGTAREVSNPTSDNFLRHADKNPNRSCLQELNVDTLDHLKGRVLIFLDRPNDNEIAFITKTAPAFVAVMASNRDGDFSFADVVLPRATFAEQNGTFTNAKAMVQRIYAAFEARGSSMPASQIAAWLAAEMGKPFSFENDIEVPSL